MLISADGSKLYALVSPGSKDAALLVVATGMDATKRERSSTSTLTPRPWRSMRMPTSSICSKATHCANSTAVTLKEGAGVTINNVEPQPLPLLVVNHTAQRIYLARPTSITNVFSTQGLQPLGDIRLNGRVKLLLAHPQRPETYAVTQSMTADPVTDSIVVLRDTAIVATAPAGKDYSVGHLVANDPGSNILALEDGLGYPAATSRISTLDPANGETLTTTQVTYMNMAYSQDAIAHNGTLYHLSEIVMPVDLASGQTGKPIFVGANMAGAALDDEIKQLFVMDWSGNVHVINTASFSETAVWRGVINPGLKPLLYTPLAVAGGRLYIGDSQAGVTRVLDAATGAAAGSIAMSGQISPDPGA